MAPPPLPSAGQLIVENLTLLSPSANYFHDRYNVTITPQTFVKHGNTVEANSALHFLLCKIQAEQADPSFKPCWPIHDREQERDFRRVVDARLAQLEKAKLLNVGVSRKSVVASAGGDRFLELLLNLSTLALQQACLQNPPYGTNSRTRMTSQASRADSLSYQGSARSNRSLLSVVSMRSERLPSETQAPQHQHHHQLSHSHSHHHHHHQHTHAQQQEEEQQQQRLGRRFLGVGILSALQQRSRDAEQVRARIDAERSALERTADLAKKGATTWASEANSLREKIVHFEAKLARLKTQLADMGFDENGNDIRGPARAPAHANSTAMLARAMDGVTVSTDVDLRPSPSRDDLADELKTSPIDSTESGSSVDEFPEPSEVVVDIAADLSRLLTFTAETREFRDRVDRSLRGDKPSLDGANGRANSPVPDAVDIINLVRAATTELQEATNRMDEIREERRKASEDSNNEILNVPTVDKDLSNAHIPDKSAVSGHDTETSISLVSAPDETEMKEQRELVHPTQHDATSPVLEDEAVEQSNVLEKINSTEELQDRHPDPQQSFDDAGLSTDIDDEPPKTRAHKNATRPTKDESKSTSRKELTASTGDVAKATSDDEYKESSSEDEVKECSSEDDAKNGSVDDEAKESSSSDDDELKVEPEIVAENGGGDVAPATTKAEAELEVSEDGVKDGDTGAHLKELNEAAKVSLQQHQSVVEACDALTKEADSLDDQAKQVATKVDDHKLEVPKLHRSASVGMDVQMLAGSLMEVRRDETEDGRPGDAAADSEVSDMATDAMKDMESAAKAIRGHGHTIEDRTRGTVAAARRKKNLMTRSLDSINLPNNPSDRTVDLCPRYDTDVTGTMHAMSHGSKSVRFAELPPSYSRSRGGSVAASGPSRQDRLTRQATEVHPKSPQSGDNNTTSNHSGGNSNSSKHSRMIAGEGLALREAAMSKRGVSTSGVKDYANNVHDLAPNEPVKRAVAISGHKPPRLERKHTPHHVGRPKEVVQRIVVPPAATRAKKVNVNRTLPTRASMSDVTRTGDVSVRPRQRSESMEDIAKLSKQQPHTGGSGHGHGHGNGSLSPSTSSHDLDVAAGKGPHSKHVMPSTWLPNLETAAQVSLDLATPAAASALATPPVSRQTSSVSFASPAPTGRSPVSVSTSNESRSPSTSSQARDHHPPPPPPPMRSNPAHLSSPSPSVTASMASTPLGGSSSLAAADLASPAASSVSSFSNFDSAPKATTHDVTDSKSKQQVDANNNNSNKAADKTTTHPTAALREGGRNAVQVYEKDVAAQNGNDDDKDDEQVNKTERPLSSVQTAADASKLAPAVDEQLKNASEKSTALTTPSQQQQEVQPPKADTPQDDAAAATRTTKARAVPPPPPQPQPTRALNNGGVSELKEEHVQALNKLSSVDDDCSKSQDMLLQTDSSRDVRRALGAGPSSVSADCVMTTWTSTTNPTQRNGGGHRPVGGKMFGKSTFMRISGVGLLGNTGSPKGRSLSMSGRDAGHDIRDVASVSNYSVDNGELSNRLNQGGHSSFSSSSGGGFHSNGGIGGGEMGQGSNSRGGGGGGFFAGQTAQWQESMRSSQQQQQKQQQHQADEGTGAVAAPADSHSMRSELSVPMSTRASTEMGMKLSGDQRGGGLDLNLSSNSNSPSGDRGAGISHHHHHHPQQQQAQKQKQQQQHNEKTATSSSSSSAHSISNNNNKNKNSNHHHSNSHHGLRFGRGTGRGIGGGHGRANGPSTAAASGGGGGSGRGSNNNNNGGNGSSSNSGSGSGSGSGRRKNRVQSFRARLAALTRD